MAVTGNSLDMMHQIMRQEFKNIGIELTGVNVNYHNHPVHCGHSQPTTYSHGCPVMDLKFTCSPDQMGYLKIFVSEAHSRDIPAAPPAFIYGTQQHHDYRPSHYKVEQVYDCIMQISVTGGSVDPLLHSFRHETEKLRHAIESMEFDQEVEKMLTEDGYND